MEDFERTAQILKAAESTERHLIFASDYRSLSNTDFVKVSQALTGSLSGGTVIKSDKPLQIRINSSPETLDNVFDLELVRCNSLEIRRQLATPGVDGIVRIYGISPREIFKRWQRNVDDLPSVKLQGNIVIAGAAATTGTLAFGAMAPDPDDFVLEALYVHSIYVVQTAVTGAPAAANFRLLTLRDAQAAPAALFEHYENSVIATDTQIRIVPENLVKCLLSGDVQITISAAPGVGTDRTFAVRLNCRYR